LVFHAPAAAAATRTTASGEGGHTHGEHHDQRARRVLDRERRATCGGYFLFTPAAGEGGRYPPVVTSQPRRRYHLQVSAASEDDTSPGLPLANSQRARGSLHGSGVDVVDLHRFSLARRSLLRVSLRGSGFRLQLLRATGARMRRSFIAVRAIPDRFRPLIGR
jgi:hypothetical protein